MGMTTVHKTVRGYIVENDVHKIPKVWVPDYSAMERISMEYADQSSVRWFRHVLNEIGGKEL